MKVAIGCDEAGYALKETLKPFIVAEGQEVEYFGAYDTNPVLYPDVGHAVAPPPAEFESPVGPDPRHRHRNGYHRQQGQRRPRRAAP